MEFARVATRRAGGERNHSGRAFAHTILGGYKRDAGQRLENVQPRWNGTPRAQSDWGVQQTTRYGFYKVICYARQGVFSPVHDTPINQYMLDMMRLAERSSQ